MATTVPTTDTSPPPVLRRPRVVLAMEPELFGKVFSPQSRALLREIADVDPVGILDEFASPAAEAALRTAEVLVTGWDCPPVDGALLDRAPRLRALIHTGGTIKTFVRPEVHERGLLVSSAAQANAVPVAEFAFAAIILSTKRVFPLAMRMREERTTRGSTVPVRGAHGITVGVIGASRVGRLVLDLLRNLDADVLLYDPHVSVAEAAALGARPADLDTLAAESDVVSVHAPDIPATYHQIDRRFLGLMRDGAVLINTARGRLVDTEALTEHLVSGRLDAILDVTDPEPLPADSPLYTLPNVLLTPHLAGAQGSELHRLGASAVAELARFAAGVPFEHPVGADDWNRIA